MFGFLKPAAVPSFADDRARIALDIAAAEADLVMAVEDRQRTLRAMASASPSARSLAESEASGCEARIAALKRRVEALDLARADVDRQEAEAVEAERRGAIQAKNEKLGDLLAERQDQIRLAFSSLLKFAAALNRLDAIDEEILDVRRSAGLPRDVNWSSGHLNQRLLEWLRQTLTDAAGKYGFAAINLGVSWDGSDKLQAALDEITLSDVCIPEPDGKDK